MQNGYKLFDFVDISRSGVWFQHATPLKIVRGVSAESYFSRSGVRFQHATPLKNVRGVACESSLVLHEIGNFATVDWAL